ncbi:MAG: aminotransferase class IV [Flavobacteriales bacterium]
MIKRELICYNGSYVDAGVPLFDENNRAFRFGDGLFETMLWKDGEIRFFDAHLARLHEGMQVLGLDAYERLDEIFQKSISNLIKLSQVDTTARVRLSVYRGSNGAYCPESNKIQWVISVKELPNKPQGTPKSLIIYDEIKKPINKLSGIKSANGLLYVLAAKYATERGYDEAILLNEKGEVCEASSSNIFIMHNDLIYTPPISSGCLNGVFRHKLVEALRINLKDKFREEAITTDLMNGATGIWLTNAIQGLIPAYFHRNHAQIERTIVDEIADNLV